MAKTGALNVGEALRYTPGVFYMPTNTYPSTIYIRGFGEDETGFYFDGIPINDIYAGNSSGDTDLAPFTTFGISEIQVSKGYTSPAFSSGKMGGAVNFISSIPTQNLEAKLGYRFISNNEHRYNAQVGRNLGDNYFQLTFSHINRQSLNYSYDFGGAGPEPIDNTAYKSYMFSGKYGFFIGDNHEYSLNFYHQHAKRGSDASSNRGNYPYYDKTAFYVLGDSRFSDLFNLNSKLWYAMNTNSSGKWSCADKKQFGQCINWTYGVPTPAVGAAWSSRYNDYTIGITETLKFDFSQNQNLKLGFLLKNDTHDAKDWDASFSKRDWSVLNSSVFTEYALRVNDMFRFALIGSYDRHDGLNVKNKSSATQGYKVKNKHLWGWTLQGILYFQPTESLLFHANVGHKTNLPKIRPLYSESEGTYAKNSDLTAESLINYELGADFNYKIDELGTSSFGATAFWNDIDNMIVTSFVDKTLCNNPSSNGCVQYQNARDGYSVGGEIYAKQGFWGDKFTLGANWNFIQRKSSITKNRGQGTKGERKYFTTHPRQNINISAQIAPHKEYNINLNGSVQTSRWAYVQASDEYVKLPTVVFFDLTTNYNLTKRLTLSVGAYNLFDKNYNYENGSYAAADEGGFAGRRVFAGFEYNYSK